MLSWKVEFSSRRKIFRDWILKKYKYVLSIFKEKWFQKASFTVGVSQIGLIILLLFIGPSDWIENPEKNKSTYIQMASGIFENYINKGSLLLSIMSLGANAAANYFWDVRKGKEDNLLFETNKLPLFILLILIFSAGITYGVIPSKENDYFYFLQLLMFLILIIGIYKINYEIAKNLC